MSLDMLIQIYNENQENLLLAISNLGFVTKEQANNVYKISLKTLNKMVMVGDLKVEKCVLIYSRATTIYRLTDKTKAYIRQKYAKNIYRSDNTQINHDYCLSKIYHALTDGERNTWMNENEIKKKYKTKNSCDALYRTKDGRIVGIEIITNSYTKEKKKEKLDFINTFCDEQIILHD